MSINVDILLVEVYVGCVFCVKNIFYISVPTWFSEHNDKHEKSSLDHQAESYTSRLDLLFINDG